MMKDEGYAYANPTPAVPPPNLRLRVSPMPTLTHPTPLPRSPITASKLPPPLHFPAGTRSATAPSRSLSTVRRTPRPPLRTPPQLHLHVLILGTPAQDGSSRNLGTRTRARYPAPTPAPGGARRGSLAYDVVCAGVVHSPRGFRAHP
jgi:hypothetical protein